MPSDGVQVILASLVWMILNCGRPSTLPARERFTAAMDEADVDGDVDIAQADDLRDAVDVARSLSSRGDVILLSPACSSFDEFSGYEERGRVFKDYVAQLAAAAKSQME